MHPMVGGTFFQCLVKGAVGSRESGRLGLASNPTGGQHLWFLQYDGIRRCTWCSYRRSVDWSSNLIGLFTFASSSERGQILFARSATPGGAIRALVGEAKTAASNRPSTNRVKEELVRFRRHFRQIYV
jgi:hypothetical protein